MKLKCSFAIIFSMLVLFSFCEISLGACTAPMSYRGTFDTWYYADGVQQQQNAKIVNSQWNMGLTRGQKARFFARFLELNVNEEIPGTYDHFIVILITDTWEPIGNGNGYSLSGISYWWKNGILTYQWYTEITIDSELYETQLIVTIDGSQIFGSLMP